MGNYSYINVMRTQTYYYYQQSITVKMDTTITGIKYKYKQYNYYIIKYIILKKKNMYILGSNHFYLKLCTIFLKNKIHCILCIKVHVTHSNKK